MKLNILIFELDIDKNQSFNSEIMTVSVRSGLTTVQQRFDERVAGCQKALQMLRILSKV